VLLCSGYEQNDRSDVELFILEPNGEKCYSFHNITSHGGLISVDCPVFGPEEYVIRNAVPGEYQVWVRLFHTIYNNPTGSIITVSIFLNYGEDNEKSVITNVRLQRNKQIYHVATISV